MEALYQLSNLACRLDARLEVDSGNVAALAADSGGTLVSFNKAFKDVDSIVATPQSTVELKVVIDFADPPNPTDFKVLVFDAAGTRANATVRWLARGIV